MKHGYPLETSRTEIGRLRMQSDLFRLDAEAMCDRLRIEPGWRCLDACCGVGGITDLLARRAGHRGSVVGLDQDPEKLIVAREWADASGLDNVEFIEGDAFDTGLEPASFDLVHTRLAMGVVPGGAKMLDHLLGLLRPGGVIFVQEGDIQSWCCEPPLPEWDRALEVVLSLFERIGADVRLGRKLPRLLLEHGVTEIDVRTCQHPLRAGEPMMYHLPISLASVRGAIVANELMSESELDAVIEALEAHLSRTGTTVLSYTLVQAAGRTPGRMSRRD